MFERIDNAQPARIRGMTLYGGLIALFVALALFTTGNTGRSAPRYAPLDAETIAAIEFVATKSSALRDSLVRSCTATGCKAGTLHPMITASAAAMDAEELREALAGQLRIVEESATLRDAFRPGTEAHRLATADWEAARRIAELYQAELGLR